MMGREWKPGDVAMIRASDSPARRALRIGDVGWHLRPCSEVEQARGDDYVLDRDVRDIRPLVVIDPESSSDQDRLCKSLVEAMWAAGDKRSAAVGVHPATMQAALRSLVSPPKPDEPQGLGAVVEDDARGLWFRMAVKNATWPGEVWQQQYDQSERWSKWSDVAAVRVLSEGVQP